MVNERDGTDTGSCQSFGGEAADASNAKNGHMAAGKRLNRRLAKQHLLAVKLCFHSR